MLRTAPTGHHAPMPSLTTTRSTVGQRGLVRPRRGGVVAGVAAGLARRYGVSASLVRILFVVSMLLPGPQILAYIALWIIMPKERRE
jgi:phage shock protein PspC (stress-responsive transcriptional regulator)